MPYYDFHLHIFRVIISCKFFKSVNSMIYQYLSVSILTINLNLYSCPCINDLNLFSIKKKLCSLLNWMAVVKFMKRYAIEFSSISMYNNFMLVFMYKKVRCMKWKVISIWIWNEYLSIGIDIKLPFKSLNAKSTTKMFVRFSLLLHFMH